MIIKLEQFDGMAPNIADHLLPANMASLAENCNFVGGKLKPWRVADIVSGAIKTATKAIYYYRGQDWLSFVADTDLVESPVGDDAFARLYFTQAGDIPRILTSDQTGCLAEPAPSGTVYPLGIPVPDSFTMGAPVGTADPLTAGTRYYVVTWQSAYGEEGPPSSPVGPVDMTEGQSITINRPDLPAGYNITHWNIYRTNTGSAATEFQFVASVVAGQASYSDSVLSEALAEVLGSTTWDAPRVDLVGLINLPNGVIAGISGKKVCYCEPYQPHAWPREYELTANDETVGLAAFGSSHVVLTTGLPYVVTGQASGAYSMEKLEIGYACVSKRSIVDLGGQIMYATPIGMAVIGQGIADIATKELLSADDWSAIVPSSIVGFNYGGKYIGFYDTGTEQGGFVIADGKYSLLNFHATGGHYDKSTGKLYLVIDNALHQFDSGSSSLTLTWVSKTFLFNQSHTLLAAKVNADAYPLTLDVYADGVLKQTLTVADSKPFRLIGTYRSGAYQFKITGTKPVNTVWIANTLRELADV